MENEKMVSMKRSPEDMRKGCGCCAPIEAIAPDYPYGLCIHLDSDEIEKLGITQLPPVGAMVTIHCMAKITRVSQSAIEGSKEDRNIGIQITDMAIEPAKD
jgi:hypothetical protein